MHRIRVLGYRAEIAVSGKRDQKIASIAGIQRGRVSRRQLLAAGISPGVIARLVRRQMIFRLHSGVYAVGHLAPIELGREVAALLAVGEGALLSHHSAAALWGLEPAAAGDRLVHVLVSREPRRNLRGVKVHRTRVLGPQDVRMREGLPVTSPARTLLDIAGLVTDRQLERALDQARVERLLRTAELEELMARGFGLPGRRALAALVAHQAGSALTRSEAEERFLDLIRRAQLPAPEVNTRVHGYEVDFLWRAQRLVVEIDGFRFHSTRRAFEGDRRKDATLKAAGLATMRVTWDQIEHEPLAVTARLGQALAWGERFTRP